MFEARDEEGAMVGRTTVEVKEPRGTDTADDMDTGMVDPSAEDEARKEGGGTAVEGSVRAPVPQGIAAPPGWELLVGGVDAPSAEAMVKRVVHCLTGALGAVNW